MVSYLVIFTLTSYLHQSYAISRHRSTISAKQHLKSPVRIFQEALNFRRFIEQSDVFVDKTILVERILRDANNVVLITSPPKFGKTMLLLMIKEFFRIELDKKSKPLPPDISANHQFFKHGLIVFEDNNLEKLKQPPAISEYRYIIDKHQGKYPVIHLDLGDISGKNFDTIFNQIRTRLKKTFEEHFYMIDILHKLALGESIDPNLRQQVDQDIIFFRHMVSEQITDDINSTASLFTLSRILKDHFKKKVIILIDNYDHVLYDVLLHQKDFPEEDQEKLIKYLELFYHLSVVSNPHYFKTVITAVLPIYIMRFFDNVLKDMMEYQYHERLYPYGGFTEPEVSKLFLLANISYNQSRQAFDWYNGYRSKPNYDVNLYNPLSIGGFVNENQAIGYWANTMNLTFYLKNIIENERFLDLYMELLNRKRVRADFNKVDLNERNVKKLNDLFHLRMPEVTKYSINVILWFLLKIGYLTICEDSENHYYLEVPNKEVKEDMSFLILNYYRDKYNVPIEYMTEAVSHLVDFIINDTDDSETLKRALQKVLRCLPSTDSNKRNVLLLMHQVITFVTSQVPLLYLGCEIVQHEMYATMILYTKTQGIIIIVKVDPRLYYTALIDAKKYSAMFTCNRKFKDISWIRYIGVEITAHKSVYIYAESQKN